MISPRTASDASRCKKFCTSPTLKYLTCSSKTFNDDRGNEMFLNGSFIVYDNNDSLTFFTAQCDLISIAFFCCNEERD